MNQENLDFLKSVLKNTGFGESLNGALENNIREKQPSFFLPLSIEHGDKKMDFKLNFKKGNEGDMYFFNSYDATLALKGWPQGDITEVKQTMYLDRGKGFTAKESFNLLDGRAVLKDMLTKEKVPYRAWAQLDPETMGQNVPHKINLFGENFGFKLDDALSKFIIREMDDPKRAGWLMDNLERGNREPVLMVRGENKVNDQNDPTAKERPTFIEAVPRFKSIQVFDENHKKLFVVNNNQISKERGTENKAVQARPVTEAADNVKKEATLQKKETKIVNLSPKGQQKGPRR